MNTKRHTACVVGYINGYIVGTKAFESYADAQKYMIRAKLLQDKIQSENHNAVLGDASFELQIMEHDIHEVNLTYDKIPFAVLETDNFRALIAFYMHINDREEDAVDWLQFNCSYFEQMAEEKRVSFVIKALLEQSDFANDLNLILQSQVFKGAGLVQSLNTFVLLTLNAVTKA